MNEITHSFTDVEDDPLFMCVLYFKQQHTEACLQGLVKSEAPAPPAGLDPGRPSQITCDHFIYLCCHFLNAIESSL